MEDPYTTDTYRWWHLSAPSPELVAADVAGHLGEPGLALDLGCGLGSELGYLVDRGWIGLGIDLLLTPLARALELHPGLTVVQADVTRLPVRNESVDLVIDRGCFHYLDASGRALYAREAERVLHAGGRLFLRMCLNSGGRPNGLDEETVLTAFRDWRIVLMKRAGLVSDTRTMPAVSAVLSLG